MTLPKRKWWNRIEERNELENAISIPNPALTGVRTVIERVPHDEGSVKSEDCFPLRDQSILVTHQQDIISVSEEGSLDSQWLIFET